MIGVLLMASQSRADERSATQPVPPPPPPVLVPPPPPMPAPPTPTYVGAPMAPTADARPVAQQDERKAPYELIPTAFTFEMGWAGLYPKPATSERLGIGRGDLFVMGLGAVFYDMLSISGDFGMGEYSDSRSFRESTNVGTLSSTATGLFGSLSAGVRTPRLIFHKYFALTAGADLGIASVGGSRGIENCQNCTDQSLSMDAGPFYALRIAAGPASRGLSDWKAPVRLGGLGISYRRPLGSSDLDHWLMITVGIY